MHRIQPGSPELKDVLHNLGVVIKKQGDKRLPEAYSNLKQAFGMRAASLGESHPDTIASYNAMAQIKRRQGAHGEA